MEWLRNIIQIHSPIEPVQFLYGVIAICGGIARYFNGVASNGARFSFGVFFMSAFISGFSGYMFALLGLTMALPQTMVFIMAGTGGFFGDQTMKYIMEYVQRKAR